MNTSFLKLVMVGVGIVSATASVMPAATWAANAPASSTATASDADITKAVKDVLAKEKSFSLEKIAVTTREQVVYLSGQIESDLQAAKAIELAASHSDVQAVDATGLAVKRSSHPLEDTYITAFIKGKINYNSLIGKLAKPNLKVETTDKTVFVDGTVTSEQDKDFVLQLIKTVKSVAHVKATIHVVPA